MTGSSRVLTNIAAATTNDQLVGEFNPRAK
jgi:hypothetical protein